MGIMWELHMIEKGRQSWQKIDHFDSVTAAARRIIQIEGYQVTGLHLEMHVDTAHESDAETFRHLEHTGRLALYAVRRVMAVKIGYARVSTEAGGCGSASPSRTDSAASWAAARNTRRWKASVPGLPNSGIRRLFRLGLQFQFLYFLS